MQRDESKASESNGGDGDAPRLLARMARASVDDLLSADMNEVDRVRGLLIVISRHLLYALTVSFGVGVGIIVYISWSGSSSTLTVPIIMLCGVLGGFVGIQRRLKDFTVEDLKILAASRVYLILAPMVGGVLAIVLYVIFLANLFQGDIFPRFGIAPNINETDVDFGLLSIFLYVFPESFADSAKLIFWSFVAGFSERFVIDVIGKFEGRAVSKIEERKP